MIISASWARARRPVKLSCARALRDERLRHRVLDVIGLIFESRLCEISTEFCVVHEMVIITDRTPGALAYACCFYLLVNDELQAAQGRDQKLWRTFLGREVPW